MKTVKEWLQELPEPQRSEALFNVENHNYNPEFIMSSKHESIKDALTRSFIWAKSEQGHDYWSLIQANL